MILFVIVSPLLDFHFSKYLLAYAFRCLGVLIPDHRFFLYIFLIRFEFELILEGVYLIHFDMAYKGNQKIPLCFKNTVEGGHYLHISNS